LIFLSSTASQALSNQIALVLGDRTTDLSQKVVMGILAHRAIKKLDLASSSLPFLKQKHVMNRGASQAIRSRDHDAIKSCTTDVITWPVDGGTAQRSPTEAIISKHMLVFPFPSPVLALSSTELSLVRSASALAPAAA
jgi:hypothetical protein